MSIGSREKIASAARAISAVMRIGLSFFIPEGCFVWALAQPAPGVHSRRLQATIARSKGTIGQKGAVLVDGKCGQPATLTCGLNSRILTW